MAPAVTEGLVRAGAIGVLVDINCGLGLSILSPLKSIEGLYIMKP